MSAPNVQEIEIIHKVLFFWAVVLVSALYVVHTEIRLEKWRAPVTGFCVSAGLGLLIILLTL